MMNERTRSGLAFSSPCKGEVGAQRREGVKRRFRRLRGAQRAARMLRRSMTKAERRLWRHLRNRNLAGFKFRRQHVIGRFVVDFWCSRCKLAIELDGGQHGQGWNRAKDAAQTAWLNHHGITVLRFWNHEVMGNLQAVLETIRAEAIRLSGGSTPTPALPLPGGGGEVRLAGDGRGGV